MKDHVCVLLLLIIIIQFFILSYLSIKNNRIYENGENLPDFIDLLEDYEKAAIENMQKIRPHPIVTEKKVRPKLDGIGNIEKNIDAVFFVQKFCKNLFNILKLILKLRGVEIGSS